MGFCKLKKPARSMANIRSGSNERLYWSPKSLRPENTDRTIKKEQAATTKTKEAIALIKFIMFNLLLE